MQNTIEDIPENVIAIGHYKYQMMLSADSGQSKVFLVTNNHHLYAAKVFYDPAIWKQQYTMLQIIKQAGQAHLQNIISMVDAQIGCPIKFKKQDYSLKAESQIIQTNQWPVIIMEFAEMGELFTLIKRTGKFSFDICRLLFQKLIGAIETIHRFGIAHRDIKLQNILLDSRFQIKLADFGLAALAEGRHGDEIMDTRVGTKYYWAPQVHKRRYRALHADLFAAGIVLFIICTKSPPFMSTLESDENYEYYRLENKDKMKEYWEKVGKCFGKKEQIPEDLKDLFEKMFRLDPERRLTIDEIRQSEWMQGRKASSDELHNFLQQRHTRLLKKSKTRQNIEKIKQKIIKEIKQFEQSFGEENRTMLTPIAEKCYQYKYLNQIEPSSTNLYGLKWVKSPINVLIVWIINFWSDLEGEKPEISFDSIEIGSTFFQIIEDNLQVRLRLLLNTSSGIENLEVSGKIVKKGCSETDDMLSILWTRKQGNQYVQSWAIQELNEQLEKFE